MACLKYVLGFYTIKPEKLFKNTFLRFLYSISLWHWAVYILAVCVFSWHEKCILKTRFSLWQIAQFFWNFNSLCIWHGSTIFLRFEKVNISRTFNNTENTRKNARTFRIFCLYFKVFQQYYDFWPIFFHTI